MKKSSLISIFILFVLVSLFLIVDSNFTGEVIHHNKTKIGYCPTMHERAISLSEKNNYEAVPFSSASEVLYALKNKGLDKALIGRKAKTNEITENTKEKVLESGYTLVSNKKSFLEYSRLDSIEVYTSLSNDIAKEIIPDSKINHIQKKNVPNKIKKGKIILIPWEDWEDSFELVVIVKGDEKVKDFRGAFLYEN